MTLSALVVNIKTLLKSGSWILLLLTPSLFRDLNLADGLASK